MLDSKKRYLQLAFNADLQTAVRVVETLPESDRILVEAGTPFIKRFGESGIRSLAREWNGIVVADLKVTDGAANEVLMASRAGAGAATVLGSAPTETLDFFVHECREQGLEPMIDMLGVAEPLKVLMRLKKPPSVVVLHKGRDEESSRGKVIPYKQVTKIKSKFDVLISAAGGVDLREASSAIFNGANIVVANMVSPGDPWVGIPENADVPRFVQSFLETIE